MHSRPNIKRVRIIPNLYVADYLTTSGHTVIFEMPLILMSSELVG